MQFSWRRSALILSAGLPIPNCTYYPKPPNLNFETDIIKIPTGDGAAIVFSFDGLHDIHIEYAKSLLREIESHNKKTPCEKFNSDGWCNCHSNFNVTIGLSDGKGIIYIDLNDNYNVAGSVINMAARVMGVAERNQIMLTKEAYTQLIEMDDDTQLNEKFVKFETEFKHGVKVEIYQYTDHDSSFINNTPPSDLALAERARLAMSAIRNTGFPIPDAGTMTSFDKNAMISGLEAFANMIPSLVNKEKDISGN